MDSSKNNSVEASLSPEGPSQLPEIEAEAVLHQEAEDVGAHETGGTVEAPDAQNPQQEDFLDSGAAQVAPDGEDVAVDSISGIPVGDRPSYRFFGVVAALSLIADITTKVWAEVVINDRGFEPIKIVGENISITLAYNQGGAWGLFAGADEMVRKPFFLGVSAFAVFFIISLYSRLHPSQKALKWGLPLVLGGALGNLSDRITRSQVIDFIDYRGDWVLSLNSFIHKYFKGWAVTDHWPTFNVADIAICIGVGLMAVDMFTHRPRRSVQTGGKNDPGGPDSLLLAGESRPSSEPLVFSPPETLEDSSSPKLSSEKPETALS